ncbi:MAG: hypothetical protein ACON38_12575 [Akkermansiaceae bacterium]
MLPSVAQATLVVPAAAETQMGNNGIQTSFYFRGGAQYLYESGTFQGPS